MSSIGHLARALALSLALAASVEAQATGPEPTWPDFRGPTWDGHAPPARVPLEWSEEGNVRWKTEIPGTGWSSPVVAGGRAWLTSATDAGEAMFVVAVDLESGAAVVERTLFENEEPEKKNDLNSYASPSPVIEDGRVYVHFGSYGTACLDTESGEVLWQRRDLECDHMEGPGSSPILWGPLLVFNMDGGDVQYVVALDKESGETRWKTERSEPLDDLKPDLRKAYSTPILVEVAGAPRLISSGARATMAYDPATGRELWRVRHPGFSMSSRPVTDGAVVYLSTGFMRASLFAVRLQGEGDVTDDNVVWTYGRGVPTMPSALLLDGLLYFVGDQGGVVTCLDAASGEAVWRERIGGEHCASPVHAAGRIYFFDREGETVVLAPGRELEVLARNRLDDGFMASPAVVGDAFVLRTKTHLYRIEED